MARAAAAATLLAAAVSITPADSPSPGPGRDSSPAAASPLPAPSPARLSTDERLKRIQERRAALEREVARLKGQEKSLLGEVERLELEVRLRGEELKSLQLVLERTNHEMDQTLARSRDLQRSLTQARPVLAARARALYKLGDLSYLRLLLSVDSPSDFFRGYRFVSTLAHRDNARITAFRSDLSALAATQQELERRTREALDLRASVEKARRSLDVNRQRKEALLTDIVEKKETHAAYVAELQAAEGKLGAMLQGFAGGEVAVPIVAFKGSLPWPVPGRVRIPFGLRKDAKFDVYTLQNGIEIDAGADAPVAAVHEGTVAFADRFLGYGLMVVVDHGAKHHTLYAHLAEARVKPGDKVAGGQILGTVGTGLEGPGLYFEMRAQGRPQDPAEWLAPR